MPRRPYAASSNRKPNNDLAEFKAKPPRNYLPTSTKRKDDSGKKFQFQLVFPGANGASRSHRYGDENVQSTQGSEVASTNNQKEVSSVGQNSNAKGN